MKGKINDNEKLRRNLYREISVSDDAGSGIACFFGFLKSSEKLWLEDATSFVKKPDGVFTGLIPSLALSDYNVKARVAFHVYDKSHCFSDFHEAVRRRCERPFTDLKC